MGDVIHVNFGRSFRPRRPVRELRFVGTVQIAPVQMRCSSCLVAIALGERCWAVVAREGEVVRACLSCGPQLEAT